MAYFRHASRPLERFLSHRRCSSTATGSCAAASSLRADRPTKNQLPPDVCSTARLGTTSAIGNCSVLESMVEVGEHCVIGSHVTLMRNVLVGDFTSVGANTTVFPNAVLGTIPQDRKYRGGDTRLVIEANCIVREGARIERGTELGGGVTQIGDSALIMAGAYIGHDSQIAEGVVVANNVSLSGHCALHRGCVIGGHAALHQHVRVGAFAMVGGMTAVRKDVLPYTVVSGHSPTLRCLNFHRLWPNLGFAGRRTALHIFHLLCKNGARQDMAVDLPFPQIPKNASFMERLDAIHAMDMAATMRAFQVNDVQPSSVLNRQVQYLQSVFFEISEFALASRRRGMYCDWNA
jgi:UDP-N-acetylglucosamine acyltransferase